jgi:antitoxin VapB
MKKRTRLKIKGEAYRLARQIADLTGESITVAVTVALQERWERIVEREAKLAAMREISAVTAELLKGPPNDHGEMLYDENGLPK